MIRSSSSIDRGGVDPMGSGPEGSSMPPDGYLTDLVALRLRDCAAVCSQRHRDWDRRLRRRTSIVNDRISVNDNGMCDVESLDIVTEHSC